MARQVADVDADLLRTRARYLDAEERRSLVEAGELYAELDRLLEERLHLPQQRPPSEGS